MSEKRIHWRPHHKLAVAEAAMEYQRLYPSASLIKAVREGQRVLPEELWRKHLISIANIEWIDEYMEKVKQLRDGAELKDLNLVEAEALQDVPVTPPAPVLQAVEVPPPATPEAPHSPAIDLNAIPLADLMNVVAQRMFKEQIAPKLEAMAESMFAKKMASMIDQVQVTRGERGRLHIVTPDDVKKQMRSKVLILGLLGGQITTIKKEFGTKLDMTFVQADHNRDNLTGLAKTHDVGIVMTRFVNHSQSEKVKNNSPHMIPVSGTISDLTNILNSLVTHGKEKVSQHNYSAGKIFAVQ